MKNHKTFALLLNRQIKLHPTFVRTLESTWLKVIEVYESQAETVVVKTETENLLLSKIEYWKF